MCNNHQTSPGNNSDGQCSGSGVYPDLTGMYGNENGQNTHQNSGAGTGQDPTFSDLMMQLMRQTERYLRDQYPEAYQQQSNNNTPTAPPAPPAPDQQFNNNATAPPQQGQDRDQQQYSHNNINAPPSAPQQSDQGRYHEQGPQYHQQQQYHGQQQQQQQGSNRAQQQQQQRRCDEADCQKIVQDLMKGFRTFRAIFGKTLVNVMMVVMVIWLLHLTPTFIIANVIFLIVAPSLGLSIGDMIACNILINIINSLPTVLLAAIGFWIFHRRFIKRQPLFTCNKWEQFKRRMESYQNRQ